MDCKYRCFKQFPNETFRETLTNNLYSEEFADNDKGQQQFCKVCIQTVNNFAPIKKTTLEGIKAFYGKKTFKRNQNKI